MMKKLSYFIENYNGAFFVFNLKENKIVYLNKKSKTLFGVTEEICDFEKIFGESNEHLKLIVDMILECGTNSMFYNYVARKHTGEEIIVDIQIGYFDEYNTEIFIELIPQNDTRLQMALHQINNSSHAQAIVNLDEKFTVLHANTKLREMFSIYDTGLQPNLSDIKLFDCNEQIKLEAIESLTHTNEFSTKMKMTFEDGKEKLCLVELEKRTLDNSNQDKVIVNITNIENQVEFEYMNQFFKAVQDFTEDIVYRIDIETMTLHHLVRLDELNEKMKKFGQEIPDYINTLINDNIIHPDDQETYRKFAKNYFNGVRNECIIRFSILNDEFEWYSIKGYNIYDEKGNFKEIVGTLVNVDSEHKVTEKANSLSNYFEALQKVSGESFYIIDVKNKILTQKGEVAKELNILEPLENFPESIFDAIHPEDLEKFKEYNDKSCSGTPSHVQLRVLIPSGEYLWYELNSQVLFDNNGDVTEVIGKMNNIQKQVDLEKKANFDNLTKVLSRENFEEKVIADLKNLDNKCNALIFIDLDDFKFINDNYGHKFGDFVLKKFSKRIGNCIKKTDLFGRVGGDEFVVYLKDISNSDVALNSAKVMIERMNRDISNGEASHNLGLSIGIAITPTDGLDLNTLYDNADKALYVSKSNGKNTVTLYTKDI